jgi:hypothetical protein
MSGMMSLLEAAAKFAAIAHDTEKVEEAIIKRACQMVCAEAKRVIGEGYPECQPFLQKRLHVRWEAGRCSRPAKCARR